MKNGKRNKGINTNMKHLLFIIILSNITLSQTYPKWFLRQGEIGCGETVVGYAEAEYYQDSTHASAFYNCCINYAKNEKVNIQGGQGFWGTEIGTFWMGSDIKTIIDSTYINLASEILSIEDVYITNRMKVVLAVDKNCKLKPPDKEQIILSEYPKPEWIGKLPENKHYYYATGQAPGYYYEASSWLEAEGNARIALAKQKRIQIKGIEKLRNHEGQNILKEEVSVTLSDIKIESRWVDVKKNIFYILAKIPVQ